MAGVDERAEWKRVSRELERKGPKVCCECKQRLRPALPHEMGAIDGLLREGDWPGELKGHELRGAKLCVICGHVVVLTQRDDAIAIWCPGFGLHERVVGTAN